MQAMAHDLGDCPLCGRRLVAGGSVNQHHLVPQSRNDQSTVALHRICHSAIQATLSEKELERQYHSWSDCAITRSCAASSLGCAVSRRSSGCARGGDADGMAASPEQGGFDEQ
jgi:hypothetical protein